MYSTKQFNALSATFTAEKVGFIAEKEPYSGKGPKGLSRHKGRQFQTIPPKSTMDGGGYFDKFTYTKGEEFVDRTGYLKKQPLEARKLGFGSHDASCRDEFTSHTRTEQYRELLKSEGLHTKIAKVEDSESDDEGGFPLTSAAEVGRGVSAVELAKPSHGRVAITNSFYNRGHLG